MSDKDKKPGVLKRISSNRDIKLGLLFLAIAVLFAFVSVEQDLKTYENNDEFVRGQKIVLSRKYEERSARLDIRYDSNDASKEAVIHLEDSEFEDVTNYTIMGGDNKTIDLQKHEYVKYVWANFTSGEVEYTFTTTYTVLPYSLLAFPAMGFTLLGVIFSLKGKSAVLTGIGKEKKEEEMEEKLEEKDEDEMSRIEESRKEQGLQRRSGEVRDDIKFMGIDFKKQEEEDE